MKDVSQWQVPKWPFLAANVILIAAAAVVWEAHPSFLPKAYAWLPAALVVLGALLGCLPYVLEYRATTKLVELNALSTVAEQLADLKKYSEQMAAATGQWAQVQETTKGHANQTVAAAKEVAEKMADEIRDFNDFQVKLNDTEKGALRLEVEKLRRTEAEWLQVFARVLDHIFALNNAAARSGNADLAEQIGHFQTACRDAARRVGLSLFTPMPDEPFDAQKQRVHGVDNPPAGATVAETLAPGMTFQGRLLRPALVRLCEATVPEPATPLAAETNSQAMETPVEAGPTNPGTETVEAQTETAEAAQLTLETE